MKPLKVSFTINGPMLVSPRLNHFDDLLAFLVVEQNEGDWTTNRNLPLEPFEMNGARTWRASAMRRYALNSPYLTHSIRRSNVSDFAEAQDSGWFSKGKKGLASLDTSRGEFKAYNLYNDVQDIATVVAYCIGDEAKIASLLKNVTHIGKKTAIGYGRVQGITVEVDENAHERWQYRHMPESFTSNAIDYELSQGRLISPYWSAEKSTILEPIGWWSD